MPVPGVGRSGVGSKVFLVPLCPAPNFDPSDKWDITVLTQYVSGLGGERYFDRCDESIASC